MKKFKVFFCWVVAVLSLSTVSTVFLLQNDRFFLVFEDLVSRVSLFFQVDTCQLRKVFEDRKDEILVKIYGIKSFFLNLFVYCLINP